MSLPTEETLLVWRKDTLIIKFRVSKEVIVRLIAGHIVLLQESFTRDCLMAAGFTFSTG